MSDKLPEAIIIESELETNPETKVDLAGVTPGLAQRAAPKEQVINLKCRRDNCDSMRAVEIDLKEVPSQVGQRVYRCIKCGHTLVLRVGGPLNI